MIERFCVNCGCFFETEKQYRRICNTCKMRNATYHDKKPYIVVSSPVDKELGLPEIPLRARFSYDDVQYTLKANNFPTGLILRKKGVDFRVVGNRLIKLL